MKQVFPLSFRGPALGLKIMYVALAVVMAMTMPLHAKSLRTLHYSAILPIDVHGKVLDENGLGIPGATIKVKNIDKAAITDTEGNFSLKGLPDDAILVVSYVGYITQEVKTGPGNLLIKLVPQSKKLDEVVVIGYGSVKKSDLTGSVGTVKAETLQERPVSSLNQGLSGRVSGVNVSSNSGRPGARSNIRIRGSSSLSVSNNPLYVIDGVILNPVDLRNGSTPIDYLNPNDIASIEVLKDASSTAIYGARGANGVILVTTKRGTSGGGKITYDPDFSIGVLPKKLAVLNSKEFLAVEDLAYANAQKYDPIGWATGTKYTNPKTKRTNPKLFDANGNPLYDTDWQEEAFQKAFTQNHQLGITDGDEKRSIGAFLNYRKQEGLARGSWQKRFAGRFVFDSQIKSWIKIGGTLSYTNQDDKQVDQLDGGQVLVRRNSPVEFRGEQLSTEFPAKVIDHLAIVAAVQAQYPGAGRQPRSNHIKSGCLPGTPRPDFREEARRA